MFLRRHEGPEMRPGGAGGHGPRGAARSPCDRAVVPKATDAFGIGAMDCERLAVLGIPRDPARTSSR